MLCRRKKLYVIGAIVLALALVGGILLTWGMVGDYGKEQDKIYSGAKLVFKYTR